MEKGREAHWQEAWDRAGLARGDPDPVKAKFYAVVAYPGSSGFLHVGHLRGLAYADFLLRFHRMNGRAVFFPTGTHMTGLPAVTFAQKVERRDPLTVRQLEDQGVPQAEWPRLHDPEHAGRFLGRTYLEVFREFGLLIDRRAYVTTVDADYRAFIRWQFRRLERAGALGQAPHYASVCPVCGPVSVDPSETDLSKGGTAEWVTYRTIPFRLDDGRFLLAATLRPETVFGATNVWVAPSTPLTTWHFGDGRFLVSPSGGRRLVEQVGGHLGAEVRPERLTSATVEVPLSGRRVPVLASSLVDPSIGTGVVMSVPSHAPADWLAVEALPDHERHRLPPIEPILEVDLTGATPSERELMVGPGPAAERAARATGARTLADREAVEHATERLYRLELVRGRMLNGILGGVPVPEARRLAAQQLAATSHSPEVREFSEPVVCRNGHEVIIQRVPDQWFIRYGDAAWKLKDRELLERLDVSPEEYRRELPAIIDWLGDRPCTRRGRWLGTPFPLDESWLIEPIADSTLYPAYFPIRTLVADGEVPEGALTDAFFDYVILGEGPGEPGLPRASLEKARAHFRYWYPLDLNIAGKEHKRVHFPVFLATHALLLPPSDQPRGLFLHGWLTDQGGRKISKKEVGSKGGAIPLLRDAFQRWGADALRLFYATSASPSQDVEWDPAIADAAAARLDELARLVRTGGSDGGPGTPELERWLESRVHDLIARAASAFEAGRIRDAAEAVYAEFPATVRRFLVRGGEPGPALARATRAWIALMSPITPHLAEELGEGRGSGPLVAASEFPRAEAFERSPAALAAEDVVDRLEEDLKSVLKPAISKGNPPDEAVVFVAAPWKRLVEAWLREAPASGAPAPNVRALMDRAKLHPELAAYRGEIAKYAGRVAAAVRSEPAPPPGGTDDLAILRSAQGYLVRRFKFRSIEIVREETAAALDPMARRDRARPGRPAFYLFGGAREGRPAPAGPPEGSG